MDEHMRFAAQLLQGEKMAVVCRELDISRKTGHKIFSHADFANFLSRCTNTLFLLAVIIRCSVARVMAT